MSRPQFGQRAVVLASIVIVSCLLWFSISRHMAGGPAYSKIRFGDTGKDVERILGRPPDKTIHSISGPRRLTRIWRSNAETIMVFFEDPEDTAVILSVNDQEIDIGSRMIFLDRLRLKLGW